MPEPFDTMSKPDYPATCNRCRAEGTNASMQSHSCVESEEFDRTERIEQTRQFFECDWDTAVLIDDCMGE